MDASDAGGAVAQRGVLAWITLNRDALASIDLLVAVLELVLAIILTMIFVKRFDLMKALFDQYVTLLRSASIEGAIRMTWQAVGNGHWALLGQPISIRLALTGKPFRLIEAGADERGFDTLEQAMRAGSAAGVKRLFADQD